MSINRINYRGVPAEQLAHRYLTEYFKNEPMFFPINPFRMLKKEGIECLFRPFSKNYEGMFIPATNEDDIPVVGINLKRPILRQRFTAAHELCHYIKDVEEGYMICTTNEKNNSIESYADSFAAELLMPEFEFKRQIDKYEENGIISFDSALKIAAYFGVSFQSCVYKLAYQYKKIDGDINSKKLKTRMTKYKPNIKRMQFNLDDTVLYRQLFDSMGDVFKLASTPIAKDKFKNEYIFYDSRMEGIDVTIEKAAEVVTDLRLNTQQSQYCNSDNEDIIQVAGLSKVYDYIFDKHPSISIYDTGEINHLLFSLAPCPDFGGKYRNTNTLVSGSSLETVDYNLIPRNMLKLKEQLDKLVQKSYEMKISEYIESTIDIHYELTKIHAYVDGNGRTYRAFLNLLFLEKSIPPIFFHDKIKEAYKEALSTVDKTGKRSQLYELF